MGKTQGTGATTEGVSAIKWRDVFIPDNLNIRHDLPKIAELAQSLKDSGQLTPIVVMQVKGDPKPYTLVAGARRMAAFAHNGWQDREILATLRQYAAGDDLGPVIDNWKENADREDVDTLDNAERVHQLLTGCYYTRPGVEAKAIDQDSVATLLGVTRRTIQKLAKVHRDVDADVAGKARKHEAPSWLIIRLSQIAGEGEENDAILEDRAKKQMALLDTWIAQKAELEGRGRQRAERGSKSNGKKNKAKKKQKSEEEEIWGAIDPDEILDKKERTSREYFELLSKKVVQPKLSKEEQAQVQGALLMMRFLSHERQSLPFVSERDWNELMPAPVEEEAAAE